MNKKQLTIELAMPILFIILSLFVIASAVPMGKEGFFPIMSAVVLLLCAIYLFFESVIKREAVVKLEGVNLGKVGITLLILIVYAVLMKKIGYVIDTFLLCVFIIRFLGYKNLIVTALCAILTVCATFVVFKLMLSVPLPMIFLNF